MFNPFPVPQAFKCPYCEKNGSLGKLSEGGLAHYSHLITESKKVGFKIHVSVATIHAFATEWNGNKWVVSKKRFGSSKMCERVELGNGSTSDWIGYDPDKGIKQ